MEVDDVLYKKNTEMELVNKNYMTQMYWFMYILKYIPYYQNALIFSITKTKVLIIYIWGLFET